MSERKILFSVEIDNINALKAAEQLTKELETLKSKNKDLNKAFKEGELSIDDYAKQLARNQAEIRAVSKALQAANREIDNTIKANTSAEGSYNKLSAQYSILKEKINALGEADEDTIAIKRELEAQALAVYNEMKRLQEATGKTSLNVGNYREAIEQALQEQGLVAGSLEEMRARLKLLNEQLAKTVVGSEAFKDLKDEADSLKLAIWQAEGKLNEFGETDPKNKAKKVFQDAFATAGVFANTLQLVNSLTGENETLAEAQAKALQAIAVAQTTANIVKEKGAIIDTLALVKTKALTVAQRLYALAVGQSTGAMKALRVALISTGIGALIVGLGLLIANFKDVTKWISNLRGKFIDFLQSLGMSEKMAKAVAFSMELIISPITLLISGINELRKAFGLIDAKKVTTDIDALNAALERSESSFNRQTQSLRNQIELAKASGKSQREVAQLELQLLQKKASKWNEYDKAVKQHVENIRKSGRSLTDDEAKALADFTEKLNAVQLELQKKEAEIARERNEKAKEITNERKKIEEELRNEINALRNALIKDEFERRKAEIQEQRRLAEEAAKAKIEELRKSGVLTEAIRNEVNERLLLQQQQFDEQLVQLDKDRIRKQEEAERAAAERREQLYQQTIDGRIESIDSALAVELEMFKANAQVLETTERGRIERVRQLAIEELNIRKRALEQQLHLLIEFTKKYGDEAEEEKQKIQELKAALEELNGQIFKLQNAAQAGTIADAIGLNKEQLEAAQNTLNQIADGFSKLNEIINAGFQKRLNEIDAEYNAREEAIRSSLMSEKQKEKALQKLEKERALKRWQIEKEQFEVNQATAIINAIIQGALAVVTAFAQLGPIGGAIATALIAATTAAQIAVISSQPPPPKPQFFEGGFTEQSGNPYAVSRASNSQRTIHHNEYVVPWKVLRKPEAAPLVSYLEKMRLSTSGTLGISGFADGGFVNRELQRDALSAEAVANVVVEAVKNVQVVTRITDIQRVSGDVARTKVTASL